MRSIALFFAALALFAVCVQAETSSEDRFGLDAIVSEPFPSVDGADETVADVDDEDDDEDEDEDEEQDTALEGEEAETDAADELSLASNPDSLELIEVAHKCSNGHRGACQKWRAVRNSCQNGESSALRCSGPGGKCACKAVAVAKRLLSLRGLRKSYTLQKRVRLLAKRYFKLKRAFKISGKGRGLVPAKIRRLVEKTFDEIDGKVPPVSVDTRRGHSSGWKGSWEKWGWNKNLEESENDDDEEEENDDDDN